MGIGTSNVIELQASWLDQSTKSRLCRWLRSKIYTISKDIMLRAYYKHGMNVNNWMKH